MEERYFICKTSRMLEFLRKKGFVPCQTLPDYHNPKYYVWKFIETPEFIVARDEWFAKIKDFKNNNNI